MGRKKIVFLTVTVVILLSLAAFIPAKGAKPQKDELYEQIELFAEAASIIRNDYVNEVNLRDLIYGALKGMLMSLDSHSQFLDPDAYKDMKAETEGKFGGLGIEITIRDGVLTVISPIEDTPAFKAGIKPHDKIVRIDGKTTKDATLTEAVKKLRGEPGTHVTLTILREEEKRLLEFTITRDIVEIKSIKEASILEDGIGYIKLIEFQENTQKDITKALAELKFKGMDSLILDLRNNPGGLLDTSVKISEMFLPPDKIVVSTKGRVRSQNTVYKSDNSKPYLNFPLIVLVNEGSASASEIVAGAIKDNKRGIIAGAKTFGKGSVQTVIPLADNSALRLTTAEYFTPNGTAINNVGIIPDVVVSNQRDAEKKTDEGKPREDEEDIFERPELKGPSQEEEINPGQYDVQLERAVDLIKGIKAYEALREAR